MFAGSSSYSSGSPTTAHSPASSSPLAHGSHGGHPPHRLPHSHSSASPTAPKGHRTGTTSSSSSSNGHVTNQHPTPHANGASASSSSKASRRATSSSNGSPVTSHAMESGVEGAAGEGMMGGTRSGREKRQSSHACGTSNSGLATSSSPTPRTRWMPQQQKNGGARGPASPPSAFANASSNPLSPVGASDAHSLPHSSSTNSLTQMRECDGQRGGKTTSRRAQRRAEQQRQQQLNALPPLHVQGSRRENEEEEEGEDGGCANGRGEGDFGGRRTVDKHPHVSTPSRKGADGAGEGHSEVSSSHSAARVMMTSACTTSVANPQHAHAAASEAEEEDSGTTSINSGSGGGTGGYNTRSPRGQRGNGPPTPAPKKPHIKGNSKKIAKQRATAAARAAENAEMLHHGSSLVTRAVSGESTHSTVNRTSPHGASMGRHTPLSLSALMQPSRTLHSPVPSARSLAASPSVTASLQSSGSSSFPTPMAAASAPRAEKMPQHHEQQQQHVARSRREQRAHRRHERRTGRDRKVESTLVGLPSPSLPPASPLAAAAADGHRGNEEDATEGLGGQPDGEDEVEEDRLRRRARNSHSLTHRPMSRADSTSSLSAKQQQQQNDEEGEHAQARAADPSPSPSQRPPHTGMANKPRPPKVTILTRKVSPPFSSSRPAAAAAAAASAPAEATSMAAPSPPPPPETVSTAAATPTGGTNSSTPPPAEKLSYVEAALKPPPAAAPGSMAGKRLPMGRTLHSGGATGTGLFIALPRSPVHMNFAPPTMPTTATTASAAGATEARDAGGTHAQGGPVPGSYRYPNYADSTTIGHLKDVAAHGAPSMAGPAPVAPSHAPPHALRRQQPQHEQQQPFLHPTPQFFHESIVGRMTGHTAHTNGHFPGDTTASAVAGVGGGLSGGCNYGYGSDWSEGTSTTDGSPVAPFDSDDEEAVFYESSWCSPEERRRAKQQRMSRMAAAMQRVSAAKKPQRTFCATCSGVIPALKLSRSFHNLQLPDLAEGTRDDDDGSDANEEAPATKETGEDAPAPQPRLASPSSPSLRSWNQHDNAPLCTCAVPVIDRGLQAFTAAEVIPGLYLGSNADAHNAHALRHHGISLVLNVAEECTVTEEMKRNADHIRYVQIPLKDHSDEVIAPLFAPLTLLVHEQLHRRQIYLERKKIAEATAEGKDAAEGGGRLLHEDPHGCHQHHQHQHSACSTAPSASVPGEAGNERRCRREGDATPPPHGQAPTGSGGCRAVADGVVGNGLSSPPPGVMAAASFGIGGGSVGGAAATPLDESQNPWVATPSVTGQPNLKEGRRETPRTPGPWGGSSHGHNHPHCAAAARSTSQSPSMRFSGAGTNSTVTQRSVSSTSSRPMSLPPSPLPTHGDATFPLLVAPGDGAAAPLADAAPPSFCPSPHLQRPASPPPPAMPATATAAACHVAPSTTSSLPSTAAPTPTPAGTQEEKRARKEESDRCEGDGVVDARDCGGVLIHCRMGVSRSASFTLAYLILYGTQLAKLEERAVVRLFAADAFAKEKATVTALGGQSSYNYDLDEPARLAGKVALAQPASSAFASSAASAEDTESLPACDVKEDTASIAARGRTAALLEKVKVEDEESDEDGENDDEEECCSVAPSKAVLRYSPSVARVYSPSCDHLAPPTGANTAAMMTSSETHKTEAEPGSLFSAVESGISQDLLTPLQPAPPMHLAPLSVGPAGNSAAGGGNASHNAPEHGQEWRTRQSRHGTTAAAAAATPTTTLTATLTSRNAPIELARPKPFTTTTTTYCQQQPQLGTPNAMTPSTPSADVDALARNASVAAAEVHGHGKQSAFSSSSPAGRTPAGPTFPDSATSPTVNMNDTFLDASNPRLATPRQHAAASCRACFELRMRQRIYQSLSTPTSTTLSASSPNARSGAARSEPAATPLAAPSAHSPSNLNSVSCMRTPALTFREAFDFLKAQKSDVNPNIGFVLALRELANGGDFSISSST